MSNSNYKAIQQLSKFITQKIQEDKNNILSLEQIYNAYVSFCSQDYELKRNYFSHILQVLIIGFLDLEIEVFYSKSSKGAQTFVKGVRLLEDENKTRIQFPLNKSTGAIPKKPLQDDIPLRQKDDLKNSKKELLQGAELCDIVFGEFVFKDTILYAFYEHFTFQEGVSLKIEEYKKFFSEKQGISLESLRDKGGNATRKLLSSLNQYAAQKNYPLVVVSKDKFKNIQLKKN